MQCDVIMSGNWRFSEQLPADACEQKQKSKPMINLLNFTVFGYPGRLQNTAVQ